MKKTVVIGASEKSDRYSNKATLSLQQHGHEVVPIGIKEGTINGLTILKGKPHVENVDTVTLYVGPQNQAEWYEYVASLHPKRVVFNPGTENPDFEKFLQEKNIETIEACTLVMLSIGNY